MELKKISDNLWEIPKTGNMKVPCVVVASEKLLEKMKQDRTLSQLQNVATLPGIQKNALVMPDGHEGYGFPIGGVAALDTKTGGVSPGGVGFDIDCGIRLVLTNLNEENVRPILPKLLDTIFKNVPSGLGSKGKVKLSKEELDNVLNNGVKWAVKNGYGWDEDLEHIEENGCFEDADANVVSDTAKKRGMPQLGSLGSGNHFIEIQKVDKIFDAEKANAFGITKEGQVVVMIHTGSRGLGHQVCSDLSLIHI